jgi:hypothetical protein
MQAAQQAPTVYQQTLQKQAEHDSKNSFSNSFFKDFLPKAGALFGAGYGLNALAGGLAGTGALAGTEGVDAAMGLGSGTGAVTASTTYGAGLGAGTGAGILANSIDPWAAQGALEAVGSSAGGTAAGATAAGATAGQWIPGISNQTLLNAGISLLGGFLQYQGTDKAIQQQVDAANKAIQTQQDQYNQTRADLAPWRDVGGAAIKQAGAMTQPGYNYLENDPGAAYRMQNTMDTYLAKQKAMGLLGSGRAQSGLVQRIGDQATQGYQQSLANQLSLAGMGYNSANAGAGYGQNTANQVSGIQTGLGNAEAAATMSGYGAANNMLTNFLKLQQEGQYSRPFYDRSIIWN